MNKKFEKWLQANEWQIEVHMSNYVSLKKHIL